jgi:hypothetical protein
LTPRQMASRLAGMERTKTQLQELIQGITLGMHTAAALGEPLDPEALAQAAAALRDLSATLETLMRLDGGV